MASIVAVVVFVFSLISFAAYCSLTSVVYWIHQQQQQGRIGLSGTTPLLSLTTSSAFRAAGRFNKLSWHASPLRAPPKQKGKKPPIHSGPTAAVAVVPEASMLVHFFTGSEFFTRVFEGFQFAQAACALVLKTASAIDLTYLFVDASPELSGYLDTSPFLRPLVATGDGMSMLVFACMVVCLLVPPATHVKLVRATDLAMIALHLLLVYFLWTHATTVEWVRQGPKATYGAAAARLPVDAEHYSESFTVHQRFFFTCAATLTSFFPHGGTPSIFRTPPSNLRALPQRVSHQVRALTAQLGYFILLGIAYDYVLPLGRATSRLAVFNFVDYRTWLTDAEKHSWAMSLFALVPLIHLLGAARGLLDNLLNTALRVAPGGFEVAAALTPSMRRMALVAMALIVAQVSITLRPLYHLVFCNSVLHVTYLALYLYVWHRPKGKHRSRGNSSSVQEHLAHLGDPSKEGLIWYPSSPQSLFHWLSCVVAMAFWASIFLYWTS